MLRTSTPKARPKKSILEDDDLNDLESFLTRRESSSSSDLEDLRKKNVKKASVANKGQSLQRTSSNLSSNSESDIKEELNRSNLQKDLKKSPSGSSLTSYTMSSSDSELKINKTLDNGKNTTQIEPKKSLTNAKSENVDIAKLKQKEANISTPVTKNNNNIPYTPVSESPDTKFTSQIVAVNSMPPSTLKHESLIDSSLDISVNDNATAISSSPSSNIISTKPNPNDDLTKFIQLVKGQQKVEFDDSVEISRQKDQSTIQDLNRTLEDVNAKLKSELKANESLLNELNQEKMNIQAEKLKFRALQDELDYLKNLPPPNNKAVSEDTISIEEYQKLKKDMIEQETLIKGYQKENERLTDQIKQMTVKHKQSEDYYLQQTQKLTSEIVLMKEEHNKKLTEINNRSINNDLSMKAQELQEYKSLVEQYKVRELEMKEELDKARKSKKELEGKLLGRDVDQIYHESHMIEQLKKQLWEQDQYHNKEIDSLNNKLKWFVENQQIVNKKEDMIVTLQNTIKDLERRLKSIPPPKFSKSGDQMNQNETIKRLQEKIKTLEKEKQDRDEAEEGRLRALRQEHEQMKVEYDKKLQQLELHKKLQQNVRIKELEAQVEAQRNLYRNKMKKKESPSLNKQNKVDVKPSHSDEQNLIDAQNKINSLETINSQNQEVINKQKETINKLSSNTPEYAALENQNKELEKQIWRLQEENHQLQGKLRATEMFRENVQDSTTQLFKQWQTDIVDKMRQIKSIQGREIQTIVEEYQAELDSLKRLQTIKDTNQTEHMNILHKLQQELAASHATIRVLESKVSKYKILKQQTKETSENKQTDTNNTRLQNLHKALASSQSLVTELSEKVNILEIELQHSHVRKELTSQLQNELKLVVQENITLSHKVELLQKQLDSVMPLDSNSYFILESKILDIEAVNRKKVSEMEAIIASLQEKLQDQRKEFQKNLHNKNNEIEGFRRELDDLLDSMIEVSENVNYINKR